MLSLKLFKVARTFTTDVLLIATENPSERDTVEMSCSPSEHLVIALNSLQHVAETESEPW